MRRKSLSATVTVKDQIQAMVRAIVIQRDGGCVLRDIRNCGGYPIEGVVLQADHLVTRANSATYADTRLIVCACRSCHGWKHWNKEQYDALVKTILPKDRLELWDRAEKARWTRHRAYASDWKLELAALKSQYNAML